jgi:hypothetical protein
MPPARFEPVVSARERPQTHALGRAATTITAFPGVPKYLSSQETDECSLHNTRSLSVFVVCPTGAPYPVTCSEKAVRPYRVSKKNSESNAVCYV